MAIYSLQIQKETIFETYDKEKAIILYHSLLKNNMGSYSSLKIIKDDNEKSEIIETIETLNSIIEKYINLELLEFFMLNIDDKISILNKIIRINYELDNKYLNINCTSNLNEDEELKNYKIKDFDYLKLFINDKNKNVFINNIQYEDKDEILENSIFRLFKLNF